MNCLFCKIISKEIKAEIVLETSDFLVFKDVNPQKPVHLLIVPKDHVASLKEANPDLIKDIMIFSRNLGEDYVGYRIMINAGKEQEVDHLHIHLLAEKRKRGVEE